MEHSVVRRSWRSARSLGTALAIVALAAPVRSDDLTPPPWRFGAGTTFQHWHFPPANPAGPAPDAVNNPFGAPTLTTIATDWRATYQGRIGVWHLTQTGPLFEGLLFDVPNTPHATHDKELWLQITYHAFFGPPVVEVSAGLVPFLPVFRQQTTIGGWTHVLEKWTLPFCPSTEFVKVGANPDSGVAYVDQVVIDTICSDPIPASSPTLILLLAGLGLGSLVFVLSKRR